MRFTGERQVQTPVDEVWSALHDASVLRSAIPGVEDLVPLGCGRYAATLAVRVGPVADTYRGSFTIEDPGTDEIRVLVEGRGRFGRLTLDLRVDLEGQGPASTNLRYEARATVSGFVARVGTPAMTVVGGHLTGMFFRDLERALRPRVVRAREATFA